MIYLPRRHFFNAIKEMHYNKKREKPMGGHIHKDGDITKPVIATSNQEIVDTIQASYDSLNLAIDRLDKLIHEFVETCPCKDNKSD
jgi:hypothetical protein